MSQSRPNVLACVESLHGEDARDSRDRSVVLSSRRRRIILDLSPANNTRGNLVRAHVGPEISGRTQPASLRQLRRLHARLGRSRSLRDAKLMRRATETWAEIKQTVYFRQDSPRLRGSSSALLQGPDQALKATPLRPGEVHPRPQFCKQYPGAPGEGARLSSKLS